MNESFRRLLTLERFERADFDAALFDHEAHVYVAWLYLQSGTVADALARMSAALQRIAGALGVPDKYHATVTWFYLLLIAERHAQAPQQDWAAFRQANRDLFDRENSVLNRYYSAETLASDDARRRFVLPDRLAA
ncbi:MAG: hypothetical protein R3288_04395 [Woeseiaceae bacterium]|nr:hypothetical protein [Woeseiaceae bacterium]